MEAALDLVAGDGRAAVIGRGGPGQVYGTVADRGGCQVGRCAGYGGRGGGDDGSMGWGPVVVELPKRVTARTLNVYAVPLVSPVFVRVWEPVGSVPWFPSSCVPPLGPNA